MSFRRKVVLVATLALFLWGFGHDASTAEPRDKPLPPYAKFAQGLFSGNQEPNATPATEKISDKPAVTTSQGSIPKASQLGRSEVGRSASTATTAIAPEVSPSTPPTRQDDSSLRATVAKLKARRRSELNLEANREQRGNDTPTAEIASHPAPKRTVERPSGPQTEVPFSELPGADLQLYSTPPYQSKITHRGITDHAATRTESLRTALDRLQQEREEAKIPPTSLAENQLREPPIPTQVAEAEISPHDDVPIANAIAGDLEASRPAPPIRSSDLASRPSKPSNPLRERSPEYRSLRVSDWQETPTSVASMATAESPSTIQNRFADASEPIDKAIVSSPAMVENPYQFSPLMSESHIAEKSSSFKEETPPTSAHITQNTVHNPYISVVESDSPRLDTEQTGIVPPTSRTYFANPRDTAIATENRAAQGSEGTFTKILNQPETPAANFVFDTRLSGDEEKMDSMVFNTWITPAASDTDEATSPQPAIPDVTNPTIIAGSADAENSETDAITIDSKDSKPLTTSYRTMTIPTRSRTLIRPGRVVEVASPPAHPGATETPTANLDPAKQEVVIDRSSGSTTSEQESRQPLPRRGPVIKPSPRPIALPRR